MKVRTEGPEATRIGWIGTGVMGAPMCAHLIDAGFPVVVYNRTREKAESLIDKGARWAESPKVLTKASDIVFTMVGYPEDVREVYFGESGILAGAREGRTLIDMTTTSPSLSREIHAAAKPRGVRAVDAPVSGGDVGAREAKLSIMVGGDDETVEAVMPLLRLLGGNIVHQGRAGSGQHAKMCNQTVIAGTMIGVCESLLYAARAGLDPQTVLASISGGAAACWSLDNLAPRMIQRDFEPGFYVDHFVKDMEIALQEADRMRLDLPGLKLVHTLYQAVQEQGWGKSGTQALLLALEQINDKERDLGE